MPLNQCLSLQSVVEAVLESNTRAQELSEQACVLQGALENGGVDDIIKVDLTLRTSLAQHRVQLSFL